MASHAQIRKEPLRRFNTSSITKTDNLAHYPVQIVCNYDGERWVVNSRMTTTNPNMKCPYFSDPDKAELENLEMTVTLQKLLIELDTYAEDHPRQSMKLLKENLYKIIKGEDSDLMKGNTFISFIYNNVIPQKHTASTKEKYVTTCKHIAEYDDTVTFGSLTKQWLMGFEEYLKEKELAPNTIHIQLRNIRSAFNQAIMEGETDKQCPFLSYKMPRAKNKKMAFVMTAQEFADFRDYPVPEKYQRYKDFALLSFYLGGLNPADILNLRSLIRGRVVTTRQKTGVEIDLPVCEEALEIIDKYRGEKGQLVNFNVGNVSSLVSRCDRVLKKIGHCEIVPGKLGWEKIEKYTPMFPELTLYTFRRTFATIAAELDVPTENIAQTLGHRVVSPFTITEVYIVRSRRKTDMCINTVMEYLRTLKGRSKEVIDKELTQYS